MLLTNYQITELIFATVLFPFFYFLFLYVKDKEVIYWDIIWCTITLFIALLLRDFSLNYNILQSQNQPMNNY
jgi:hypothetical protein